MKKLIVITVIIQLFFLSALKAQNDQASHIIKTRPFSPLLNYLDFSYEKKVSEKVSNEFSLGIIGPGLLDVGSGKELGLYGTVGRRFYLGQDWSMDGMKTLGMRGYYLKPEAALSMVSYERSTFDYSTFTKESETHNATGVALLLNLGRQFIFAEMLSLDISAGLGYGITSDPYPFRSHYQFSKEFPLAAKSGISIGYIF